MADFDNLAEVLMTDISQLIQLLKDELQPSKYTADMEQNMRGVGVNRELLTIGEYKEEHRNDQWEYIKDTL